MNIREQLNLEQKRAVEICEGPLIIVAGPGTGKTRTLIAKIEYLLSEKNVPADQILALTFTKKAASEMRERLDALFNMQTWQTMPFIGTFHALAHDLLSRNGLSLKIITDQQRNSLIRGLPYFKELSVKEVSLLISQWKSALTHHPNPQIEELVQKYNQKLKKQGLYDYDDLLLKAYEMLSRNAEKADQFRFILVDEFQDTNDIQYQLLKLLARKAQHICVIGDPLQSIYAFRGATDDIFRKFTEEFPKTQQMRLKTNYRSAMSLITASHGLFPDSPRLDSYVQEPGKVQIVSTLSEYTEADWVIRQIQQKIGGLDLNQTGDFYNQKEHARFSDIAIIYRTHHIGRVLENQLQKSGIPYQIVGGISLFEQKEVRFLIACLQYLHSKNDGLLRDLGQDEPKLDLVTTQIEHNKARMQQMKLAELTAFLIDTCNLNKKINKSNRKQSYIREFQQMLVQFQTYASPLEKFLEYVTYISAREFYDTASDRITLLTMHAAKGLEFPFVFVCGFEEGLIPFTKKGLSQENLEEEKRLLYVAMTRAKKELYLIHAQKRDKNQQIPISSFYKFIKSPEIIEIEDDATKKIESWRKKQKQKKSQLALF